ncbi:hypothetical protein CC85DRAFT_288502 [Cutaneotrichosporon oleaginosum]|uniref:Uncharacterized protein n=1 Tax=Cutaneotrichosporon oleaginosum TaxID=879819 RepID=A0A0J0XEL9_9TREE|nr:uncharacterized protein CC85DRAFT_288502 [Cutaneotrichosporon oleaginosum]KLT39515.1 hypothetical protein CC85DRAFT_288502 [Cutaneotrichosporon oleaginosum]TXT06822.1 hypothetical protein COLE_06153 [Cutaneotrichosporon oleaginosum]
MSCTPERQLSCISCSRQFTSSPWALACLGLSTVTRPRPASSPTSAHVPPLLGLLEIITHPPMLHHILLRFSLSA